MLFHQIRCMVGLLIEYYSQQSSFDLHLGLTVFLSTVFTSPGRAFVGLEMKELGFSSTRFLTVSIFSSIILVQGGPESVEGPEAINL